MPLPLRVSLSSVSSVLLQGKDLILFWGLLVFVVRNKVRRVTGHHQHSELHDVPSWGCRVVGTGGIPQPQQPEGLRDQAPRIAPEKQLWTRAPEWWQGLGKSHRGTAVGVVIM